MLVFCYQNQTTSLPSILKQPVSGTSKMVCTFVPVCLFVLHSIQFWNVFCRIQEDGRQDLQYTQKLCEHYLNESRI